MAGQFKVEKTFYGGRGCFAVTDIPANTLIHVASAPFASVIFRDFRKEVCGYCFAYDLGKTWKIRLSGNLAGLWFCTESCRDSWIKEDSSGNLVNALDAIEITVTAARKKMQTARASKYDCDFVPEDFEVENGMDETLDRLWDDTASLLDSSAIMKNPARNPQLKTRVLALEDVEYDLARLIAVGIVRFYLEEQNRNQSSNFSWQKFFCLESHERDLIAKLPSLLESHVRVYLFLKIIMPEQYQQYITTANVRGLLGREAANAFGIWQIPLHLESECLGSSIYPSASYFNHSCDPNVLKTRTGRQMHFITTRPVKAGQELCISYGMLLNMPCSKRKEFLHEQWYFDCNCTRCLAEMQ
ncbi:hypothetical protein V1512DRAFT_278475 [Lipomyces arxii]|uniref:uncharacterized protein n=1 Tax=Lipomyces arxii TaxID=56418 RepID=UPI0034CE6328